mgnify:CR=1 FL=1|tara:strand:+ start:18349 stop:18690 length:342 start_codon:yes stop_codon:yes gene_type:complete
MSEFNILVPVNQCPHTGIETIVKTTYAGNNLDLIINQLTDNYGRNRFTLSLNNTVIASILFDENNICMFRETHTNYRKQGLNKDLWAFAASILGNIKHSDYMTEDGQKAAKIN